jgi:hypothetical protein
MPRRPDRDDPEPPEGGRAAERLRDFLRRRSGEGTGAPGTTTADDEPSASAGGDADPAAGDRTAEDEPAP